MKYVIEVDIKCVGRIWLKSVSTSYNRYFSSTNTPPDIKLVLTCAEHVVHMQKTITEHEILVRNSVRKRLLERPTRAREYNIKMDFQINSMQECELDLCGSGQSTITGSCEHYH